MFKHLLGQSMGHKLLLLISNKAKHEFAAGSQHKSTAEAEDPARLQANSANSRSSLCTQQVLAGLMLVSNACYICFQGTTRAHMYVPHRRSKQTCTRKQIKISKPTNPNNTYKIQDIIICATPQYVSTFGGEITCLRVCVEGGRAY
jgi:hypothetical protein